RLRIRPAQLAVPRTHGSRIGITSVPGKVRAFVSHVTGAQNGIEGQVPLDCEVPLLNIAVLHVTVPHGQTGKGHLAGSDRERVVQGQSGSFGIAEEVLSN